MKKLLLTGIITTILLNSATTIIKAELSVNDGVGAEPNNKQEEKYNVKPDTLRFVIPDGTNLHHIQEAYKKNTYFNKIYLVPKPSEFIQMIVENNPQVKDPNIIYAGDTLKVLLLSKSAIKYEQERIADNTIDKHSDTNFNPGNKFR